MFYIDDYNSKTITNTPPAKKITQYRKDWENAKIDANKKQLQAFFYLAGVVIGKNYDAVKELLSKYGYEVSSERDAATAISDMIGKKEWPKFLKEFGDLMEDTVDESIFENLSEDAKSEESGWVEAVIAAVGSITGGALSLASSKKTQEAAKENAKATMFSGLAGILAEKEKTKAEMEKTKQQQKKGVIWIILGILLIVGIVVTILVVRARRKKANG